MLFTVLPVGSRAFTGEARAFLVRDAWDDWFKFSTLFHLWVVDQTGTPQSIGSLKIGQFGLTPTRRAPAIPESFDQLDSSFFSLGQDDSYYVALNDLGVEVRDSVLQALQDIAMDETLFGRVMDEEVAQESLFRFVSPVTVRTQFRRLARGYARLTPYRFRYESASAMGHEGPPLVLSFDVVPDSEPPTNVHVLIGRNGVGKTFALRNMARSLVEPQRTDTEAGQFLADDVVDASEIFANLVSVTFSAFDMFDSPAVPRDGQKGVRYTYVGLQSPPGEDGTPTPPKTVDELANEFIQSIQVCRLGSKRERWLRALEVLESDPLFREAQVVTLGSADRDAVSQVDARSVFRRLSSGHKIVLLTMTKLVESVDERTLVLLDEPEAHLHPPLLSAFVRAISNLLVQRNGVAIIATHSPVVLQEVPRVCVWKLRRSGAQAHADRPQIETFGENVAVLTAESFGLEVTDSGFHQLLKEAVDEGLDFVAIRRRFADRLGAEALAIVRARIAARDEPKELA